MSDSPREVPQMVGELARTVEDLQSELEPDGRPPLRPPTPRELARFTSEVTIPAIVLALETNVRVLKLLQRTLRMATGESRGSETASPAREQAQALGQRALAELDRALTDLGDALEGRPPDDRARSLLEDARRLRNELDEQLAATGEGDTAGGAGTRIRDSQEQVNIDVESELQSIKDDMDDGDSDSSGDADTNGDG